MKKIFFIFMILFSCSNKLFSQKQDENLSYNFINSFHVAREKSIIFLKQNVAIISCIPLIYYYHKNIFDIVAQHPYLATFCLYLLLNYALDCKVAYQEQNKLIHDINLLKNMALYLVICHGIKNHIHNKTLYFESIPDDNCFLNNFTDNLSYSFDHIEQIIIKTYKELKKHMHALQNSIIIESESFVFLCHTPSINVSTLLYLTENDPKLYQLIYDFEKNPHMKFSPILDFLKLEITQTFRKLEQHLLQHQIYIYVTS